MLALLLEMAIIPSFLNELMGLNMKMRIIKELYLCGGVTSIDAKKIGEEWLLQFKFSNNTSEFLETSRSEPKMFSTLEYLLKDVKAIVDKDVSLHIVVE